MLFSTVKKQKKRLVKWRLNDEKAEEANSFLSACVILISGQGVWSICHLIPAAYPTSYIGVLQSYFHGLPLILSELLIELFIELSIDL